MRKPSKKSEKLQKIALERIHILFDLAKNEIKKHPERSKRYIELMRTIGMRYNVRIPKEMKRQICKKCNSYLLPGYNCKIRSAKKIMLIECLNCGNIMRYPYIKENLKNK